MNNSVVSNQSTLPAVKDIIHKTTDFSTYIEKHNRKMMKKRKDYVQHRDSVDDAMFWSIIPAIITFIASWLIPIFLGASADVFIPVGIVGGLVAGGIASFISTMVLYDMNVLEAILERKAKKKFPLDPPFDNIFALDVVGDNKSGKVEISIKNTLEDKILYSQVFDKEEEIAALDIISEAKDLVLEANNDIKQKYVDHMIESEGFVKRMLQHSTN